MKIKILILTIFACLVFSGLGFADEIIVSINGNVVENDGLVLVESGVLYGLVSEFANNVGIEVKWLENAKLAVLMIGEDYVSFGMETNQLIINNRKYEMANHTIVRNGRIYAPIDVLFEHLDIEHEWNEKLVHVELYNERLKIEQKSVIKVYPYTEEELLWLARIIEVEARGKSINARTAVGNVVMNRVASPRFPNTVFEVIYQRGQFPPAHRSTFASSVPTEESVIAAKRAFLGVQIAKDCLFFNYIPFKTKSDDFYKLIEGNYFYY
ncbi:MAG TPA: hypothetical protein DCS67_01440 [Clostridiales bacterium UBA8960]|jgi:hypothetical protein|nr:hypothetical protein [Clostridiales bacterium UBA8960]